MAKQEAQQARDDFEGRQKQVAAQWKAIAEKFPAAVEDLFEYLDTMEEMYIDYGKERSMPGPDGKRYPIDNDTIAALLQAARACGMVKTYIEVRIDPDVAQPIKKSK